MAKKYAPYVISDKHAKERAKAWFAVPRALRSPRTQKGLAEALGVSNSMISRWKKDPEFQQDVERYRRTRIENHISDLYQVGLERALAGDEKFWKMMMDIATDTYNKRELTLKNKQTIKDGDERNLGKEDLISQMQSLINVYDDSIDMEEILAPKTMGRVSEE